MTEFNAYPHDPFGSKVRPTRHLEGGFLVQKHFAEDFRGEPADRWATLSKFTGKLDDAIKHARQAYSGRLRILDGETAVWTCDGN